MFTGIIQSIATISKREIRDTLLVIEIDLDGAEEYEVGDSISLNGICSTVTAKASHILTVEYMKETQDITTVMDWKVGNAVNVESPLTLQAKLSGGLVSGHVDVVGEIHAVKHVASQYIITVKYPIEYAQYVVPKGSVTLDGINLTIVDVVEKMCTVHIIPHTWEYTTLAQASVGDSINIEFDYFAKLVTQLMDRRR